MSSGDSRRQNQNRPHGGRMENHMKKDVLINIRGVYSVDDDQDVIELFTTGKYYKKNGEYYICYDETEATGFQGSRTTLRVNPEKVVLQRSGTANSQLIVEQGVRHQCQYDIGYGDMMIGISGGKIKSTLDDAGGNLIFKYSLDVNSLLASENEMHVHVKESAN